MIKKHFYNFSGLLIILAVFIFFRGDAFGIGIGISDDAVRQLEGTSQKASAGEGFRILRPPHEDYRSFNLRDPFQGPAIENDAQLKPPIEEAPEEPLPSLSVEGVIWGGSVTQAIINGKIVKVGDNIQGAQVVTINDMGVTVYFGKKTYVLPSPRLKFGPAKGNNSEN